MIPDAAFAGVTTWEPPYGRAVRNSYYMPYAVRQASDLLSGPGCRRRRRWRIAAPHRNRQPPSLPPPRFGPRPTASLCWLTTGTLRTASSGRYWTLRRVSAVAWRWASGVAGDAEVGVVDELPPVVAASTTMNNRARAWCMATSPTGEWRWRRGVSPVGVGAFANPNPSGMRMYRRQWSEAGMAGAWRWRGLAGLAGRRDAIKAVLAFVRCGTSRRVGDETTGGIDGGIFRAGGTTEQLSISSTLVAWRRVECSRGVG